MKLKFFLIYFIFIMSFCLFPIKTFAYEIEEPNQIPMQMQPGTVIVYDEMLNPIIEKGGYATQSRIGEMEVLQGPVLANIPDNATAEEKEQIQLENEIAQIAYNNFLAGNYVREDPLQIYPGMKVEYDSITGNINNIYYVDESEPSGYSIHNIPNNNLRNGISNESSTRSINATQWVWGSHNNTLIYQASDDSFLGNGRATYFTGTIGNRDNTLKDRDCATKMVYDFSKVGDKDITVRNIDTNTAYVFYQADVGTLPDAIIDIWGLNNLQLLAGNTKDKSVANARYYHKRFSDQEIPQ